MKKTGIFKNENGNMSILEFLKLIDSGELINYARHKVLSLHKCPPSELIIPSQKCFYCVDCIRNCKDKVKVQKTGYKISRKKYKFKDLEKDFESIELSDFKREQEDHRKQIQDRGW